MYKWTKNIKQMYIVYLFLIESTKYDLTEQNMMQANIKCNSYVLLYPKPKTYSS